MLVVAPAQHDHAVLTEAILDLDDLAGAVGGEHLDDVQRFVQHELRARHDLGDVDVGCGEHAHLASGRDDVHRAVVVRAQEDAEGRGRLAEFLDLFREGLDALALGPQRVGELLVLARGARELVARLDELLLEHRDLTRRAGEATPQQPDLFLQEFHLGLQLMDLVFVLLDLLAGHRVHLPCSAGVYPGL